MNYTACKIRVSCDFDKVKEWADYLQLHPTEVSQSLSQENVDHEMWFYGEDTKGGFLIGVMDCTHPEKASVTASNSNLSVDIVHRQFKKFWLDRELITIDPNCTPEFPGTHCLIDARPL